MTKTFRELSVDPALCDALERQSITHPFAIQELTLPLALQGSDLIGQARTGTGKTLAFGLPLLQRIDPDRAATQALVVVPTRELCLQVADDLTIGAARGITSVSVYGGVAYEEQTDALRSGVHVVVGTPGRLLDQLSRRNLDLSQVTELVLDEADEMLDMGFLPDVERLIEACTGDDRHTMLFSATMPTAIVKLARRYLDRPTFIRADTQQHETAPTVTQRFLQVHRMDKPRVLARILQAPDRGGAYVFVRTKHMADRLVSDLEELGVPAIAIHGDLRQQTRERNLDRFRQGKATVLVATEVAARGLDVTGVTHVVNYDCPDDEKMYLHRIGRTARAGESGMAVTFAEFNEVDRLNVIRKAIGATDTPVEQVFSTSERLTELFDLPDERPWDRLGGGGRGERRRGTSDGRPKSTRRSEGRGDDHDAHRERRDTARQRTRRDAAQDPPGRREGAAAAAGGAPPPDEADPPRVRTRVRTRTAGDGTDRDREQATTSGRGRDGARRPKGGSGGDATPPARAGSSRQRARGERTDATSSPRRGRAGAERAGDGDQPARDRRPATPDGDQASEQDRRRRGARRGHGGRGDGERHAGGRGEQRSGRQGGDRGAAPTRLERRGVTARGEGQPQLSRRVRVDHLP